MGGHNQIISISDKGRCAMKNSKLWKIISLCLICTLGTGMLISDAENVMAKKKAQNEENQNEENVPEDNSSQAEYIIPASVCRYLNREELEGMSLQVLNYAKNEMYAREGRIFRSNELRKYFENTSWYIGSVQPDDFKDSERLNEYELKNTKLLSEVEHEISADGYQVDQPGYSADPVYEFISKHNGQNQDSGENEETKQSIAAGLGETEEDQAYIRYNEETGFEKDSEDMYDLEYAVKDLDGDGFHEFILKGKKQNDININYKYIFYRYKDGNVQMIGSLENWQNGGNGEMYTARKKGTIIVFWRIADRKTYRVYNIGDSVEETMNVYCQDTTCNDAEGKRIWEYGTLDADRNSLNVPVSNETEWTEFEKELKEIKFFVQEE